MSKGEKQQVPKIRFNRFNGNWLNKSFADCFDIQNGYAYKSSNFVEKKTGKIILTPGSVALGGGYRADKGRNYSSEAEIPANFIFKSGDIFITLTDLTPSAQALGYPAIVPTDDNLYLHNQRLGKIINSKCNPPFLYSLLRRDHYHKYIVSTASGTTVKHSSATAVLNYETRMPEINEQVKIGIFFQQLDRLIELQTRAVEIAERHKKAMLQKLFPQKGEKVPRIRFAGFSGDWIGQKLGNSTKLITKGTTPKINDNCGEINFIKVENLNNGLITPTYKTSKFEHDNYLKRSKLEDGDILFSIAGTLGRTAVVNKDMLPANTNQALSIIRGYDFNTYFLITILSGNAVKEYIRKNPTIGAQPNLSLEQVRSLQVLSPSLEEQTAIGDFFQKLDEKITSEQRKLARYQMMKRAMLQRMFV